MILNPRNYEKKWAYTCTTQIVWTYLPKENILVKVCHIVDYGTIKIGLRGKLYGRQSTISNDVNN